jgi:two-component system chemotaxis response regulator CheB
MASAADRDRPADRLIAIGASAGGVEALSRLVAGLPEDLPAAVVVVLHLPGSFSSRLAEILTRAGRLRAIQARDGSPLKPGCILVAPPGYQLVVQDGRVRLLDTPRVNGVKPAVDLLFQSGAREYGSRIVAVVLTGTLRDGSAGLTAVRKAGGVAVVQDPNDAAYSEMPKSALDTAGADHCVPLKDMAALLESLSRQGAEEHAGELVSPVA